MVKNPPANAGDARDVGLIPGLGRKWQPTPVFLPGEFHGQRRLVGCNPWGRRVRPDIVAKQLQQQKAVL